MSKRFGRNQKRRMKQEIEGLSAVLQRCAKNEQRLQGFVTEYLYAIKLTADVLGRHFCTLPPEVIKAHRLDRSLVYRMAKPMEFPMVRMEADDMKHLTYSVADAVRELDMYRAELRTDKLADQVHVRIHGPRDEGYAYAISSEMKRMYPKDRLIEQISRELAMLMVREWRDGRP